MSKTTRHKGYEIHIVPDSKYTVKVLIIETATLQIRASELVDIRVLNPMAVGYELIGKLLK